MAHCPECGEEFGRWSYSVGVRQVCGPCRVKELSHRIKELEAGREDAIGYVVEAANQEMATLQQNLEDAKDHIAELEAVLGKLLGKEVLILDHYGRALIPHPVADVRYMVDNVLKENHERT